MFNSIFLLIISLTVNIVTTVAQKCGDIKIENKIYRQEVVNNERPSSEMFVIFSTNTLVYNNCRFTYLDLDTKQKTTLQDTGSCQMTSAVDQERGIAYIGLPNDAVITFDSKTKKITPLFNAGDKDILELHSIEAMFFKNKLYFVSEGTRGKVFTYENGMVTEFHDLQSDHVTDLIVDDNDLLYFVNHTGLYRLDKKAVNDQITPVYLSEDKGFLRLTVDRQDKPYFSTKEGIFRIEKTKFTQFTDIKNAFIMTFDKENNLIYRAFGRIVRLVVTNEKCE